jgi:glutamyl-tRNA synthetase
MNIKVRFAPSPTGNLHIGGLRAALFNYYFAKQNNGKFVIRIEDTDHSRNKEEYIKAIIDSFLWCNIASDEPIIYQSQRNEIYKKYIEKLIQSNKAYYSDEADEEGNISKVIKCKVDKNISHIRFNDIIRGEISFPTSEFDDFIIVRSDGTPLYNLVVVIDDILMNITHIIRGEEHLSNTPKQLLLYNAFNKTPPQFAHLPLILGSDKKKLSKRDAATSVIDYKKEGYLPEALCMYLLRLGWAYKDQEIFTQEEIFKYFKLENIHHAGAIFDNQKLLSINQYFIKQLSILKLYDTIFNWDNNVLNILYKENDLLLLSLYQSRSQTLLELINNINLIKNKPIYKNIDEFNINSIKENIFLFKNTIEKSNDSFDIILKHTIFKNCDKTILYKSIRFAILGIFESPSIIEIMNILKKNEVLIRLELALNFLNQ